MARMFAVVVAAAAVQCLLCAVVVHAEDTHDDPFADAPVSAAADDPPELVAFQSYMGYLNKAVPMLGILMLVFVYMIMNLLDRKKSIVGPKVHVSHILVEDEATADALRKEIKQAPKKSQKFAEVAARKSKCPSKSKGGHMGVFGKGQMMPEFDAIVFTEPVGSLHVVRTKFGWHVLMITKREGAPSELKWKKQ